MKRLFPLGLLVILFFSCSSGTFADRYYERYPYHHHYRLYSGGDIYCSTCHLYHRSTHHHFRRYDHTSIPVEQETVVRGEKVIGAREIVE
jgi:hypothetical protein